MERAVVYGEIGLDAIWAEDNSHLRVQPGTPSVNVARFLGALGSSAVLIGMMGGDAISLQAKEMIAGSGVDVSRVLINNQVSTPVVLLDEHSPHLTTLLQSSLPFAPTALFSLRIQLPTDDVGVLVVSPHAFLVQTARSVIETFWRRTRPASATVFADLNLSRNQWTANEIEKIVSFTRARVDVVKVSEEDLAAAGLGPLDLINHGSFVRIVWMTHGSSGATAFTCASTVRVRAENAGRDNHVYKTGDAFTAGLVDWFLNQNREPRQGSFSDEEIAKMGGRGSAVASLVCKGIPPTHEGAFAMLLGDP